ncbi:bifunctional salicylyl-CoA 5-hydroxylase/oxidoreductase [Ideonella sp. A 288]|uniref:bifunctional salicylyl-CoA 5-hydroxylase/oxidoreductase n=1 Tax=Ideonella sp. A 288 TaxID=1962181 RepID=UPI000B4B170B|nr:bifunctional salicylyl-CoA 5-hydroxylase/oxidoreductase [Ideonella sp. A 288]
MRITCLGGGPAGLYFGLLMKRQNPAHEVTVVERNKPYDTFGWGVVFSDATMDNMRRWDPETAAEIQRAFNHWDDIELHFKGEVIRSGGHGFVGIGRKTLLNILQRRCEQLGVRLVFETEADSDADYPDSDLVIASDGISSKVRTRHAEVFKPDIVVRPNRYIWLGTHKRYDAFTFLFEKTEHGWFQAHIYKFDEDTTTFIVECPEHVWKAHGLDQADQAQSIAFCERLFADNLQGEKLMTNARHLRGSAWLNFQRVTCEQWSLFNGRSHVVLMGDAVHTAHFAIGSGTKLAIEDAIELARLFGEMGDAPARIPEVLARYQALRRIDVLRLQNAAWNAMEWFEVCGSRYCDQLPPQQFMYSMLTRSQRISHENLRLRDAGWLGRFEAWFAERAGVPARPGHTAPPPMFTPYTLRSVTLKNRVVVSPMAQYSCVDGVPGEFHLVHLGSRAMGGAGMVVAEMTCPSADARITPGCPGLWTTAQRDAWKRIVDFVHRESDAKIAVQIGHAGPKGSTNAPWQGAGADQPLAEGRWPLLAASARPYLPDGAVPRAMTRADMDRVRDDFVRSTLLAAEAGFDWIELHCAHGYLLSCFISPLTNHRSDDHGGPLANRLRFPLEVFTAVRAAWPAHLPMSVRISAHDWVEGGITPADAVAIAQAFKAAGADMIDCSSGQVSADQQPSYGRMYQTPFADRIRNEAGIATIAVGAISEADHVNSIIAAGRADLCAVARPHLAHPAWTLHEAARIGFTDLAWPRQYASAKSQLERNLERERTQVAQTALFGPTEQANRAMGV